MTLKSFEGCTLNLHVPTTKKSPNKRMWQKQTKEIMCMATQVSSFLLTDGDGTFRTIMKLVMSNRG
jgi:hypothetical protein